MTNLLMSVFCFAFTVTSFLGNFQYGRWIHGYLGLYDGVAMGSVINFDDGGRYLARPRFDEDTFEDLLGEYITINLSPYAKTQYQFFFEYDGEICVTAGVRVAAKFMLGFSTLKEAVFRIVPQSDVNY